MNGSVFSRSSAANHFAAFVRLGFGAFMGFRLALTFHLFTSYQLLATKIG
jgi:hypothetical protein